LNDSETAAFAVIDGNAHLVGPDRIWRFTIKSFAVTAEMIPSKT
jgi:hypothetical protein